MGAEADRFITHKIKKIFEQSPLAIENLWKLIETDTFKSLKDVFDEELAAGLEESSEAEEQTEAEERAVEKRAKAFLREQNALFEQFDKGSVQISKDAVQQADYMLSNELSYKLLNANLVKYFPLHLKNDNIRTSFVKVGGNEQLFLDLVNGIQFAYFVYFKETPKSKRSKELLNSTSQICSSLIHNYIVHKSTYEQHLKIFQTPLIESFVGISMKVNNVKIKTENNPGAVLATFKRPINYKIGNRFL